jgi:hypothetical protein
MPIMPSRSLPIPRFWLLLLIITLTSCGGDGGVGPDATLAQFVGDWDASRFVVKSKANPEIDPDLIADLGAEFSVNVQPSGQYTAILVYQGFPITEIGTLEIEGSDLIFHVDFPEPKTTRSRFTFAGPRVTLVGDTEFDYNFDGTPEPAEATIELIRR